VANLAGSRPMTAPICALNGLIILVAVGWWSYRYIERWRRHDAVFVGLLSAGMLGNSIDRLALGHVRDFLVTPLWPSLIFNLADVFIVSGFLLILGSWVGSRLGRPRAARSRGWSSH
jgi:lipoprotein signal peptidase